jgi:hypothetical protein
MVEVAAGKCVEKARKAEDVRGAHSGDGDRVVRRLALHGAGGQGPDPAMTPDEAR